MPGMMAWLQRKGKQANDIVCAAETKNPVMTRTGFLVKTSNLALSGV